MKPANRPRRLEFADYDHERIDLIAGFFHDMVAHPLDGFRAKWPV
jgi:hypothetical protein